MEFTKKTKLMTATLVTSIAGGLIVAGFAMNKNKAFKAKAEDVTYTLTLGGESKNGKIAVPQGQDYAESFTALAKAYDGHTEEVEFGGSMLAESANENKFGKIMYELNECYGGYFYNITPINSIKSITIFYEECDRDIDPDQDDISWFDFRWSWDSPFDCSEENGGFLETAYYGYEPEWFEEKTGYVTCDFFDELPNYFYVEATWDSVEISSIQIEYSCTVTGEVPEYYSGSNLFTTYKLNDDGKSFYLDKYYGDIFTEITVPSTYRGMPVTKIGQSAFQTHTEIETIVLPESISDIGYFAFEGCTNLKNINLDNTSITTLGESVFYDSGIESIILPSSLVSISKQAFEYSKLREIIIPSLITEIGNNAFSYCPYLEAVYYRGEKKINSTLSEEAKKDLIIFANSGIKGSIHFYFERSAKEEYTTSDFTSGCYNPIFSYNITPEEFEIARGRGTK